jgi:hypothetical protein
VIAYDRSVRAQVSVLVFAGAACQATTPAPEISPVDEQQLLAEPEPEPEQPPPPPDPLTSCDSSWWALTLPVPSEDGPRARLRTSGNPGYGYRKGEPKSLCVRFGDGPWEFVERGVVEVAADPERLQRWLVGKTAILIHVPPDDELAFRFHACMNWQFGGTRFEPQLSEDPEGRCGDQGCSFGYERRESFDDPLCPNSLQPHDKTRCTKLAVVQLVDDRTRRARVRPIIDYDLPEELHDAILDGDLPVDRIKPGTALWQSTDPCARKRAITENDAARLIVGIGERWQVWVGDDDKLTGQLMSQP